MPTFNSTLKPLVDFFIIIMGILVAFWLNQYAQDRREQQQFAEKIGGVKGELTANLAQVRQTLPYHDSLLSVLRADPAEARLQLRPAQVHAYAWQIFQNSGLENHLDYETYALLAEVYGMQTGLQNHNKRMVDLIHLSNVAGGFVQEYYRAEEGSGEHTKGGWVSVIEDAVGYERALLEKYPLVLEQLEAVSE